MKKILLPLLLSITLGIGFVVGVLLQRNSTPTWINEEMEIAPRGFEKLSTVLNTINYRYVDNFDYEQIEEALIPEIFHNLDPHSVYIPAKDVSKVNEDLEGSFSGIGVSFIIQKDTVVVMEVIAGGPSEKVGLRAGDRIVEVNDSVFAGSHSGISNSKVMNSLRGKKDTQVKLGILRHGHPDILHYTITRGDIPINSVDFAYPINQHTGYIKVSRFGANTYNEFMTELTLLKRQGCDRFIIDLRNNTGGYLTSAIQMVNEFLSKKQLIVYTEGRYSKRENAYADGSGKFLNEPLCILMNEWSASASEIFAGAMQDHDRAWIVGRRSFGKGLVQEQISLYDSSEIRLTIARYYTPSGRCIQKPYKQGEIDNYEQEIDQRFQHGEFFAKDSISFADTTRYYTQGGRIVYGGGGIMPDYFVAATDTAGDYKVYRQLSYTGVLYDFAFDYSDKHRNALSQYHTPTALQTALRQNNYWAQFKQENQKLLPDTLSAKCTQLICTDIEAYIARNILGDAGFYPILNQTDSTVIKALEVINQAIR